MDRSRTIIVLAGIIIAVVIGIDFKNNFLSEKQTPTQKEDIEEPKSTEKEQQESKLTPSEESAERETHRVAYTDTRSSTHYSMKHPSDWRAVERKGGDAVMITDFSLLTGEYLTITMDLEDLGTPCTESVAEEQTVLGGESKTKSIVKMSCNEICGCESQNRRSANISFERNGNHHVISYSFDKPKTALIEEVLSTFRFLN